VVVFFRELLPLLTADGIVHTVDALGYAEACVPVGVEASVGAPHRGGAAHEFMTTTEALARKKLLYSDVVSIA